VNGTCCVYLILNTITWKIYIGASSRVHERKLEHFCDLSKREHGNVFLQNAFDIDGEDAFEFHILEETSEENLVDREQIWLDETQCYERDKGYNILRTARKGLFRHGETHPNSKLTKEDVITIRELDKKGTYSTRVLGEMFGVCGEHISMILNRKSWRHIGSITDEELTQLKVARQVRVSNFGVANGSSKLTEEDVREILELYKTGEYSQTAISKMYDVYATTINAIVNGKSWQHLTGR